MIPDSEVNLKVLIARQLCEEFLHYRVLSDRLEELGANGDLSAYEPGAGLGDACLDVRIPDALVDCRLASGIR